MLSLCMILYRHIIRYDFPQSRMVGRPTNGCLPKLKVERSSPASVAVRDRSPHVPILNDIPNICLVFGLLVHERIIKLLRKNKISHLISVSAINYMPRSMY